jgi:hypothetical protein
MAILVACSTCGAQLRVRDEFVGQPMACPKCGQMVSTSGPVDAVPSQRGPAVDPADGIPTVLPAELPSQRGYYEDDDLGPVRNYPAFAPCRRCGSTNAERIVWTAWGSFYGPALLCHVRCLGCGYKYNGRSGRSNLLPAAIFVIVPLVLIVVIIGVLFAWLWHNRLGRF